MEIGTEDGRHNPYGRSGTSAAERSAAETGGDAIISRWPARKRLLDSVERRAPGRERRLYSTFPASENGNVLAVTPALRLRRVQEPYGISQRISRVGGGGRKFKKKNILGLLPKDLIRKR